MSNPGLVPTGFNLGGGSPQPDNFDDLINQSAQQYGLDPAIFRRQLQQESGLNPTAISPRGAKGIAQFMDPTAQEFGIDPMNPQQAIPAAAKYMRQLMGEGDDYSTALASYNWGMGNVQKHGLANAPPETVNYVNTIMGRPVLGQQLAMGQPGPSPANDPYPSYTDALGNVITRAAPMSAPQQQTLTPTGFNLAAPEAQTEMPPPLTPTGFNLNTPQPATPFNARTQAAPPPAPAPAPQGGGFVQNVIETAKGFPKGVVDLFGTGIESLGALQPSQGDILAASDTGGLGFDFNKVSFDKPNVPIQQTPFYQAGKAVKEHADIFPAAKGYEDSTGRMIGEGLGSVGAGVLASLVGGPVAAGTLFAAAGSGEAIDRAIQDKAAEDQIIKAAAGGLIPGLTDSVPIETLVGRIPVPGAKFAARLLPTGMIGSAIKAAGKIGWQAVIEGVQEGGQQWLQNLVAQQTYKPGQDLGEGIVPSAGTGAEVGALAEALTLGLKSAAHRRVRAAERTAGENQRVDQYILNREQQYAGAQPPAAPPAQAAPKPSGPDIVVAPAPPPPTPAQGEAHGLVPPPANAVPTPAHPASSEGAATIVGPGGQPDNAGQPGDQARGVGPVGVPGADVPAAGAETTGPVPAPAQQKAAFIGPTEGGTTEPVVAPGQASAPPAGPAPVGQAGTSPAAAAREMSQDNFDVARPVTSPEEARTAAPQIEEPLALSQRGELTPDRADTMATQIETHFKGLEDQAFGANADEYRQLERTRMRAETSDARAAEIATRIKTLEAAAPPEALQRLHAAYDNAPDHHDAGYWRDLGNDLRFVEGSREEGIQLASRVLRDLPHGEPKTLRDQEAIAILNHAMQAEANRGGDVAAFMKDVAVARRQMDREGVSADSANELVSDDIARMQKLATPQLGQPPAAEAPGTSEEGRQNLSSPDQAMDEVVPDEAAQDEDEDLTEEDRQALSPEDRHTLELLDRQIERRTISAAAPDATPADQVQLKRQIELRDALLAKVKVPRRKKKVSTAAPPREGQPKVFTDYKFQTGTPVFRDAFVEYALEHGEDGKGQGATMDEALNFADRAINFHPSRQVEILRHQVKTKFGFKDVTVSDKLHTKDARDVLLDFHRAAQDMMHGLALPVEMASLKGKISLALEPSNTQQYGSYAPGTKTLTINGRASVFGHEWVHAFDHDISDTIFKVPDPQPLATYLARVGQLNTADPMAVRMGNLLNAIFYDEADLALKMIDLHAKGQDVTKAGKPTPSALKAQRELAALQTGAKVKAMEIKLSKYFQTSYKYGGVKYWANPWELLARAGEAYISHTMTTQGLDPRGVVMPDEAYLSDNDRRLRDTFPKQEDRARIIQAFDHLIDGYRQQALAGSVAAAQALRGGVSDPSVYSRLSRDKEQVGAFRTLINRIRNLNDTLQRTALTDPLRPDPGLFHAWHRGKVWASSTINSRMGFLETLLEDKATPAAAKPHLQAVMDRLGRTHGTGRYTGWEPIEERQNRLLNQRMYQMTNILSNNGLDPETITAEQKSHLHHAMTTGEATYPVKALEPNGARVPIDPAISKAAKELRGISDEVYHDLDTAGLEVGYAESAHFPRLYDQVRAHTEPDRFKEHAAALHKEMFDEEVGPPGKHPDKLVAIWDRLPSEQKKSAPVQNGMMSLKANLREQEKLKADIAANGSTAAKQAQLDTLEQEAEQLAIDHHDGLGDHIAAINADVWLLNMRKQRAMDYDQTGPGGDFLNKRELPPQADRIMRDFMQIDLLTALPRYYEATSRRIAQAERFGPKGEVLDKLIEDMLRAKMDPDEVGLVKWVVDSMIGATNNNDNRGIAKAADYAHSTAAVGLMGRSAYITLPEPFTLALAHRDLRAGLKSIAASFGEVMRTASAKERAELAEWIGVTKNAAHNEIIMNRVGHDYSDSPKTAKAMALYYAANMITGLTNLNSRAAMAGSHHLLTKWSRDLVSRGNSMDATDERDRAHRKFNELGIAPEDQIEFANEILAMDGMPNLNEAKALKYKQSYSRAMYRLVKSGVLDPTKMERPMLADEKWPGLALQFLNYAFAYQRTVLDPAVRDVEYSTGRRYQKHREKGHGKFRSVTAAGWKAAEVTGKFAMLGAGMVALQFPATMLQQFLFNRDQWDKHEEDDTLVEWLVELSISRVGFGGTLDAPVQAVTSLRYDADPSSLTNGASLRWINKNIANITQWTFGPSAKETGSNARAHAGVKGLYNLIGIPLEAYAAIKLTGFGKLGYVAAAALLAYGTSQQAANRFADMVVGPKGAEPPKPKTGFPHAPKAPRRAKPTETKSEKTGMEGASNVPWGLVDDIMVPAWKLAAPVIGAVPSKVRTLGVLGAAGYKAVNFWDDYEPFRNAPPPKEKKTK